MPVIVTEQYPKAFGHTVDELKAVLNVPDDGAEEAKSPNAAQFYEKSLFSMCTPEVKQRLTELDCTSAILCGIEAHVCVLQTSLDLLEMGVDVHLASDAVSSQRLFDRQVALGRLSSSGAYISTAESLIFQLLASSKHPKFKAVQPIIRDFAQNRCEPNL